MENKIKGGKSDKMSLEDIARKHSVFIGTIKKQLEMGLKVEREHTTDPEKAKEIAMDHLSEFPDYYTRLDKMEKTATPKKEAKEQTDASCSGSYEAPMSTTILKRDIHKLAEQMDAGVSAGAMYDAPIGTAGPSSPMDKSKKKKRKDPLALDEKTKSGSVTAASTKDMISTKKGFPRFGGPKTKFVEINPKCKTYPYCNQGADSDGVWKTPKNMRLVKEAIESASKKYGIPVKEIEKIIMKEGIENFFNDEGNMRAMKKYRDATSKARGFKDVEKVDTKFTLKTLQPIEITTSNREKIHQLRDLLWHFDINLRFDES